MLIRLRKEIGIVICLLFSLLLLGLTAASICLPGLGRYLPWVAGFSVLANFVLLVNALRSQAALHREQERLIYNDTFSGLPNWPMLQKNFRALKSREHLAFVLIWLDDFHKLNSLFGVERGAETFRRMLAPISDFSGRYTGQTYRLALDRLALLVEAADHARFESDLQELLEKIEKTNVEDRHASYSYHYTCSYGVYYLSDQQDEYSTIEQILQLTSDAVERHYGNGRTSGTVYNEENKPDWLLRRNLVADLKTAWENKEFVPYYQLIYDQKKGKPSGAELLTRWQHPKYGLVMPAEFLPVLESEGYIMDLDLYMLEEACKKIQVWINTELIPVPICVNISKLNLHREDFANRMFEIVERYDVPPILIELEMDESSLISEFNDEFIALARKLHDFGFTLSVDNFSGSELSSINVMRDMPVDVIKLSRQFFLTETAREETFVADIVKMTHDLRIRTIAMGVETQEQADACHALGCTGAQGYFYSRPMSNEDFEKLIF